MKIHLHFVYLLESPSMAPSAMGSLESLNIDSMLRHTFVPDYSVRATTEVLYLKIKRSLYLAAKRATLMEKSKKGEHQTEQFDEELDKVIKTNCHFDDKLEKSFSFTRRKFLLEEIFDTFENAQYSVLVCSCLQLHGNIY